MSKKKKAPIKVSRFSFRNLSLGLLIGLSLAWLVVWLITIIRNIGQPQIDYSEGFNMWNAHLFGTGQWQWDALKGPPFNALFYTPVWYLIMGRVTNIFGDSLVVGRIFNLLTFAGCLTLVFLIVRYFTRSRIYGLIGAALPLMSSYMIAWSMFPRVDMLAILFELAGIYVIMRFESSRWLWLSIPLFVLAFYTKQSLVAFVAAGCLYLFIRNRKQGLVYSGLLAGALLAIFTAADILTQGNFFKQVFTYQQSEIFSGTTSVVWTIFINLIPILIMGAVYAWKNKTSLLGLSVLATFVLNTLVLFLHTGGNYNYFFEFVFALSLASGVFLPQIIKSRKEFYLWLFAFSIAGLIGVIPNLTLVDATYSLRTKQAETIIQDATYPILTENAQMVVDAGKMPYDEPFVYSNLARLGYFDGNIVLNDLKTNKIEYVITQYHLPESGSSRFSEAVQQAILDNYHIVMDSSNYPFSFVVYEANDKH